MHPHNMNCGGSLVEVNTVVPCGQLEACRMQTKINCQTGEPGV